MRRQELTMGKRVVLGIVFVTLIAGSMPLIAQATYHYTEFSLPYPPYTDTAGERVNSYHNVVGVAVDTGDAESAFTRETAFVRYSDGSWHAYSAPNATATIFMDRNDSGINVGYV